MFRLAICDDQCIFSDTQARACHSIFEKLNIENKISVFTKSADFIAAFVTQHKRFDMILLDIVMDGVDGMELARTIRQIDETVAIVFITSHEKYALQGYDVKALHFLMKPPDFQLLENLIKSVYLENLQVNFLTIKSGDHHIRVPIKDIISMEISKRRVEVSLIDGIVYYSGKLTDILDELPKGFFIRCHQAFAINIANIKELTRRNAIAVNGKEIPVSRTFWNDTKTAFLRQLN